MQKITEKVAKQASRSTIDRPTLWSDSLNPGFFRTRTQPLAVLVLGLDQHCNFETEYEYRFPEYEYDFEAL